MKLTEDQTEQQAFILVTPRFDEAAVVNVSCALRQLGIAVSIIGASMHGVTGLHGVKILPDCSFDWLRESVNRLPARLIICSLPDEQAAFHLSYPPIFRLLSNIFHTGGVLALIGDGLPPFMHESRVMRQFDFQQIWTQGNKSHFEFSQELAQFLNANTR